MKKQLARTTQCAKCPWKVSTNPHDIPNGYTVRKHRALQNTIAKGDLCMSHINSMACHHSKEGDGMYCIGWLVNQLGRGNNIALRLKMLNFDLSKVRTVGKQHERFEDTLPS